MSFPAVATAASSTMSTMLATNTVPGPPESPEVAPTILQNPADGAVVRIDNTHIAARAQNGDTITFFRDPMNYEFQTARASIGDFSNGTIAASENANLVVVKPDNTIFITPRNGTTQPAGRWTNDTDARKRLVRSGYIDETTFNNLAALRKNGRDLSEIPAVNADFAKATDRIFHVYQQADINRRWQLPQPEQSKPTQGS